MFEPYKTRASESEIRTRLVAYISSKTELGINPKEKPMKYILLTAVTSLSFATASVQADTLFNSGGFESPLYTLGALGGQNGWTTDGTGAATVENSIFESGSQAVRLSGTATTWHFPSLSYTQTPGEIVSVNSGIYRASSVTTTKNFGYFLDAYSSTARIARVGLGSNNNGAPAIFATYNGPSGAGTYILATGLSWDTWYDFRLDLNLNTDTFDLYVNNTLYGSNLAFLATATDLSDVDLQMSVTTGATDVGYFDNYSITTSPVPEPGTIALVTLGGLALIGVRRRMAAK